MGTFRQALAAGGTCAACAALAALCCGVAGGQVRHKAAPRRPPDAWSSAVAARAAFEAETPHTREGYTRVLDDFRAIYHANPGDLHAPAAVAQVAELLAEEGRELHDDKALRDAAGQYAFLVRAYPRSSVAAAARASHLDRVAGSDSSTVAKVRGSAAAPLPTASSVAVGVGTAAGSGAGKRVRTETAVVAGDGASSEALPVPATNVPPAEAAAPAGGTRVARRAVVSGIRHWSTPTYTRVAIDLGDDVQYEAARVENPDRIFFDLHHTRLAPELVGKSFSVTDDGFLTKIRAAQFSDDTTRVVLDVHEVTEYSAFLLPNPSRLIIDIHGRAAKAVAAVLASTSDVPTASVPNEEHRVENNDAAAREVRRAATAPAGSAASSLPPMPVTDGSSGFGLPTRSTEAGATSKSAATASAAPPRVVIPVKPTAARPVPNTVASRSTTNSTDVAAISDESGKHEGTTRPTSSPVAVRTGRKRGGAASVAAGGSDAESPAPARRAEGTPANAAPPTSDGENTLLRALGLKIGRIVIDAGHGGHDSGTLGADGIQEKDVVLDVALRLGKLLHQRLGAEIVYTRADDTFIPLETRTAIANKAQADLFISVHANSSQDAGARGVEVYYLNFTSDPEAMRVAGRENAVSNKSVHELSDLVKKIALKDKIDESRELASDVDTSLYAGLKRGNEGLKDRGVKKAPFVVLIGANMPSILAEISFVTNPDDAAQLRTPEYRERVAESLFAGVARYAGAVNGTGTKPATVQRAGGR